MELLEHRDGSALNFVYLNGNDLYHKLLNGANQGSSNRAGLFIKIYQNIYIINLSKLLSSCMELFLSLI